MPLGPSPALTRRGLLGGLGAAAVLGLAVDRGAPATPATARAVGGAPADAVALRTSAAAAPRPNILLVVADDLGRGELGSYGQKTLRTPVLDALAADGLRFDQAYATPTCAPTRFSLFTGLHTGHARVQENTEAWKGLRAD